MSILLNMQYTKQTIVIDAWTFFQDKYGIFSVQQITKEMLLDYLTL